ncbi:substrate-binding domain-containing protein [Mucilaginibacter sp. SMC90]|uniref:substrate-binding domain-containing protein n=1 Tax=Mucilaginibacter sp. SMC90 TaxID=2929803 RepID=UPI001FB25815|nr:substrate-binding domain-containing protein [Mucilaginibacter sp. SMC90]UOE46835.1 substrate-binding domain-containing protein [Mucilaginibacter sp. SMC90]
MYQQNRLVYLSGLLLCLFITVISSFSCNKAPKNQTYTIGFSQCTGLDLWRKTMLNEMKTELSLHPGVNFIYADAHGDSKTQVSQVSKMLRDKIDLLIISPNEAQPLTPIVDEAYQNNIPVIIIDRKTSSSLYTAYIGADNYELGKLAGHYLGTTHKGNLNLVEVMGLPGSSPAIERDRGFMDGIKQFPNIHVKTKIYGDWLKANAEKQLLKIKDKLNDVNAIFAHNDNMALGTRTVLNSIKSVKPVKVIGVDALPGIGGGMEMVDNKLIDASLVYPTSGKEAIVTAFKILNKEPFLRENILQSLVIDSTNVQLMKMQVNKINSQQNDIIKQQSLLKEQQLVYKSQQVVLNIIVILLVMAIVSGGLAFYSLMENRKINKSLEAKNQEIQLQRNQLIEMSAKAQAATEARLNFFTNVTHEFRTPLTLMLSPLNDMLKDEKLSDIAGNGLKMVNQNAFRLLKLVNQLIDYRKIEVDKNTIKASENNIVAYVRDIIESFRFHAKKLKIQFYLVPTEKNIPVWFDVNMLDKVFFNLFSNAIKFISGEGAIKVYIRRDKDFVYVDIHDNGVGISEEDAALIFDQFYQADNAPRVGSGIGLSLSKEIILLHHGCIEVTTKKWEGTTFKITLPLGDAHLNDNEKTENKDTWPNMDEQSKAYQADIDNLQTDREIHLGAEPKELSILLVEDNADLLQYLCQKFSEHFEVFTAADGNQAFTQAYEKVPDIIISDVVLPGYSGKEIVQRLKTDLRTSHIPVILLTAQSSDEQKISGMHSLADLYISKPFNFDYLLAGVQNLLKNRKILREHYSSDITGPEKLTAAKTLDKKFINDFAGIVEKNIANENFSIEDICRLIGISRIQLYRKIKALLGCTVNEYILTRRLKKASYLLINENLSIAEITYQVGFSSPNYFSTAFKAKYGCPPSEYKHSKVNG